MRIDDALDVSSIHGITGIIGSLAIGLVASSIVNPSGLNGLLYGNASQIGIQALGVVVAAALGFGGIIIIMKVINAVIGLTVKEEEQTGLDTTLHGEREYGDEWGVSV